MFRALPVRARAATIASTASRPRASSFASSKAESRSYEALIKAEVAAGEMGRAQALYDRAVARAFPLAVVKQLEAHLCPPSAAM